MNFKFLLIFSCTIILIIIIDQTIANDYCMKSLCGNKGQHIACNNDGKLKPKCGPDSQVIDMNNNLKELIIQKHNELRNKIASGNQKSYKTASKMATMQWDDELSKLATLNAKQCEMKHDNCRNTDKYKFSGQNLAWWKGYPDTDIKDRLLNAIQNWYDENIYANNDIIGNFRSTKDKTKQYGHFTVLVADRNCKVGCGVVKIKNGKFFEYFIACNYAFTSMLNEPIYKFGSPASECKTGKNSKYPALCSINEKYDI